MMIAAALPIVFSAIGFIANLISSKKESAASNAEAMPTKTSLHVSRIASRYDINNISPRDMAKMSRELFDAGAISFQNHVLLSFQPELNIGQSIGKSAKADERRDFVADWKMLLTKQQKAGAHSESLEQTQRALHILEALAAMKTPGAKPS
jgi:hypothetical protein